MESGIVAELARLGWTETDLATQSKSAPEKPAIAARLREETTLTVEQIAAHVCLGTSEGANTNLNRFTLANYFVRCNFASDNRNLPSRFSSG
jgi:hypothetical protein